MSTSIPTYCLTIVICGALLLTLTPGAQGSLDKKCTISDKKKHVGVCGAAFANLLSMLCGTGGGGYNKRSGGLGAESISNEGLSALDQYMLPKPAAVAYMHSDLSKRVSWTTYNDKLVFDGPMCECCHNRCDISELVQYCKNPQGALQAVFAQ